MDRNEEFAVVVVGLQEFVLKFISAGRSYEDASSFYERHFADVVQVVSEEYQNRNLSIYSGHIEVDSKGCKIIMDRKLGENLQSFIECLCTSVCSAADMRLEDAQKLNGVQEKLNELQKRCDDYQKRMQIAEIKARETAELKISLNISEERNKNLHQEGSEYLRKLGKAKNRAEHAERELAKALAELGSIKKAA